MLEGSPPKVAVDDFGCFGHFLDGRMTRTRQFSESERRNKKWYNPFSSSNYSPFAL